MSNTPNFYTLCYDLLQHRNSYFDSDFTDESTEDYFSRSLGDIHSFLQYKYGDQYLFSSIAYSVDDRIKALPYKFNLSQTTNKSVLDHSGYVMNLINYLTQNLIHEENHLSFTQVMLSEKDHGSPIKVLLFAGKNSEEAQEYKPIDIVEFDLGNVRWEKIGDIERFKIHDFVGYQYGDSVPLHERFLNSLGNNPLKKMAGDPPPEKTVEEFNRLMSVYLEINACFGGTNYFYFIKPQSTHNVFSGVLILGLKKRLPIDEFTLWVHVFHRQLSEISIKQIQQMAAERENLKYRSNINYTVHYIKTLLGGLMDKPLQELNKAYPNDENVRLVGDSKRIIEGLSAILNLITKVEEISAISQDDLVKSKLFGRKLNAIDVNELFKKIQLHRKDRSESKKVEVELGNVAEFMPLLKYQELYPTEEFFLLYFLTLIENAFEHGRLNYGTNSIKLSFNFNRMTEELVAENKARNSSIPPKMDTVKGNIKLFDVLLRILGIGSIQFEKYKVREEYIFRTILKLKYNHE